MTEYIEITCPYCGEPAELDVDETGASRQSYVQDCPVCCQPWQVEVRGTGREIGARWCGRGTSSGTPV